MQDVEGLYFLPAAKLIDYGKLELINEGYSSKGHTYLLEKSRFPCLLWVLPSLLYIWAWIFCLHIFLPFKLPFFTSLFLVVVFLILNDSKEILIVSIRLIFLQLIGKTDRRKRRNSHFQAWRIPILAICWEFKRKTSRFYTLQSLNLDFHGYQFAEFPIPYALVSETLDFIRANF